jgi:hypothetical protein
MFLRLSEKEYEQQVIKLDESKIFRPGRRAMAE